MSIEEFNRLERKEKIDCTLGCETVAWREKRLRWFYIIRKVDDFYVELKYDEFNKHKLAVDARAIPTSSYQYLVKHNYIVPLKRFCF